MRHYDLAAFIYLVPFRPDISANVVRREGHRIFLIDVIYRKPEFALVGRQTILGPALVAIHRIGIHNEADHGTLNIPDP